MRTSGKSLITLFFITSSIFIIIASTTVDNINTSRFLRDGETIVSDGGTFELGFFSRGKSEKRYLGVWYKRISVMTVVWVANRDVPLTDRSGILKVSNQGLLTLLNGRKSIIWTTNTSRIVEIPVAQLLESGNLVVRDKYNNSIDNFLWQSFDFPCDTLLPGMKLGRNIVTGLDRYLTAWNTADDPAESEYTYRLDPEGFPQLVNRKGSIETSRSGPWNGRGFSGKPNLRENPYYKFWFVFNDKEIYYSFAPYENTSIVTRLILNPSGIIQRFIWIDHTSSWFLYLTGQIDTCDEYGLCGAHGSCNIATSPQCGCLKGFHPKYTRDWAIADWSNGCIRSLPLDCRKGDGFLKYSHVKLPDTRNSWFNRSMSLEECKMVCLRNCSCMAYSSLDITIRGGSGCLLWFGELMDIRDLGGYGQVIYIRMASSEVAKASSKSKKLSRIIVIAVMLTALPLFGMGLTWYIWRRKKKPNKPGTITVMRSKSKNNYSKDGQKEDIELPLYDIDAIANATDNFSERNKLGEGGFGPVFKGVLGEGQEIAVKRLSKDSNQGFNEFENEAICIAKLQHRNLVKLLGYCIHGQETMLIYEFMRNKSLDLFIFDQTRREVLDWPMRFNIINGIARGLHYLHQDSRLRIIHRDLKASNILLDNDMNPKISDFGMARIFKENETQANTKRVVGTYGYMSPEYAIDGLSSTRSDVFSFGVLVLEMITGKRNRGFHHPNHHHNLLGHAWKLYKEGGLEELIDTLLCDSTNLSEIIRSIQVGLLCVQQSPQDRPGMSSVVLMLSSENPLPQPKRPGFFTERNLINPDTSSSTSQLCSANDMTITLLDPR